MTLEKLLFILLSLMSVALVILIILLFKQKKRLKISSLESEVITKLFHALAGHSEQTLTPDLIIQVPASYISSFRENVKNYYESLIQKSTFTKLAKLIYELENSIPNFHKKHLLMELFSAAASRISSLRWAKFLMDSIQLYPTMAFSTDQDYEKKAKRFEEFIIANAKSNKMLLLLEGDFKDLLAKNSNELGLPGIKKAGEILERIRDASKN